MQQQPELVLPHGPTGQELGVGERGELQTQPPAPWCCGGEQGPIHPLSPALRQSRTAAISPVPPSSRTCMRILPSDTKGVLSSAVKMQPTKKSPSSPLKCCEQRQR